MVLGERCSVAAICALEWPSATSVSICRSRAERLASGLTLGRSPTRSATISAIVDARADGAGHLAGQRGADEAQVEAQCAQFLPDAVVQLAREHAPFFFLHFEHFARHGLEALGVVAQRQFRPLALGDIQMHDYGAVRTVIGERCRRQLEPALLRGRMAWIFDRKGRGCAVQHGAYTRGDGVGPG